MNIELVTCVMLRKPNTNELLVQNRKKKYPGWAFPGGHVEQGESIYDCAVREVQEETGLTVHSLQACGVVHWVNRETDERYLCFMYQSTDFSGELLPETDEGEQFWLDADALRAAPKEKFSSEHYALSPLFHEHGKYSEVFLPYSDNAPAREPRYK